mmetsp:Transcript_6664/g.14710  ORF Transcript_6664/g.14710 Transcript_6664/m.14710 type:complete len:257 (+) Transcript_6664:3744-4514(+)
MLAGSSASGGMPTAGSSSPTTSTMSSRCSCSVVTSSGALVDFLPMPKRAGMPRKIPSRSTLGAAFFACDAAATTAAPATATTATLPAAAATAPPAAAATVPPATTAFVTAAPPAATAATVPAVLPVATTDVSATPVTAVVAASAAATATGGCSPGLAPSPLLLLPLGLSWFPPPDLLGRLWGTMLLAAFTVRGVGTGSAPGTAPGTCSEPDRGPARGAAGACADVSGCSTASVRATKPGTSSPSTPGLPAFCRVTS